jgi:hypothetical protein
VGEGGTRLSGNAKGWGKGFSESSPPMGKGGHQFSAQVALRLLPRFAKIPRILLLLALIGKIRHRKRYLSFIHEDTIMRQPTPL